MTTYKEVNSVWPDTIPVPTDREAIAGARRLVRLVYSHAKEEGRFSGRPPRRKFVLTSGNRYTWIRSGVWRINPNGAHFGGWKDIAHCISHWAQHKFWPGEKAHGSRHVYLEKLCSDYVIANFLDGQLARSTKTKAPIDAKTKRADRVAARLAAWEAKAARAETALRKLRRQARYYGLSA